MGFLDKMKDAANSAAEAAKKAAEQAKAAAEQAKVEAEQKKAEKAALEAEMQEKVSLKSKEIIDTILSYNNETSVFGDVESSALLAFTKDFYDRLLMPAYSVSLTKISMYPYIDEKTLEKLKKEISEYDESETPLILIKAESKQFILITDVSLYFYVLFEQNSKYYVNGKVPCSEISKFIFECGETESKFSCDGYVLATFKSDKVIREDFISLTNYFNCIANKDFEITDEEVDTLVKEKIGSKIANEIKKYMTFDDEKFVYFAWGCDSLGAKDYIVCTDKQIIVMDREAFGVTANIKQFYYEDITAASAEQNSNDTDLTGFLIDTALTAATKTCDLYFSVAGARTKIKTLYKVEAERIIAIYHQFRKEAKIAASQPQVIVQQAAPADDPIEQIKKLKSLQEMGLISEEEFNEKKAALLAKI